MGTDALNMIRQGQGQAPLDGGAVLLDAAQQDWLEAAADMGDERCALMDRYESYYCGEQNVRLTDRAREYLEAGDVEFAENFCEPIVDSIADRMCVEGFTVTRNGEPQDDLTDLVNRWWSENRMAGPAGTVHVMTLVLSEYFVFVDWNTAENRPDLVGNDPRMVRAHYADDDPQTPLYVVKRWNTTEVGPANPQGREIQRMNVYWPDRIERYWNGTSSRRGWDIWIDEDEQRWPVPWVTADGRPRGVPVAVFRNRPLGRSTGRSELRSDIPMQDALNKLVVDLMMILDAMAWQQRWVIGQSKASANFPNAPGDVWFFPSENASAGTFPPSDPSGVLASIESLLSRRARRARVPLHLLTGGDVPSGEALRSAEAPLVKKVQDRMTGAGDAWEDAMRTALMLAGEDVTGIRIETVWETPEYRDESERADAALKWKDIGVSDETLMEMNGFDVEKERARKEDSGGDALGAVRQAQGGVNDLAPFPPQQNDTDTTMEDGQA